MIESHRDELRRKQLSHDGREVPLSGALECLPLDFYQRMQLLHIAIAGWPLGCYSMRGCHRFCALFRSYPHEIGLQGGGYLPCEGGIPTPSLAGLPPLQSLLRDLRPVTVVRHSVNRVYEHVRSAAKRNVLLQE